MTRLITDKTAYLFRHEFGTHSSKNSMKTILIAVLIAINAALSAVASGTPAITQPELVRRTQELFDAVAGGNKAPWQSYLASDAMLFDETGHDMDKRGFLDNLKPLPPGYSGSIRVVHAKSRFASGVAILSYDCDETEIVFGQHLQARYHMTDTWLHREHSWRIVASQTLRYYEDPATSAVSQGLLRDYLGTYELATDNHMTISLHGADLYAQRGSGASYKLLPETTDLFFRAGVEGRRLFHRDKSGRVDLLIDRRNNEDLIWKKIR
jgi:hypothetical protein